MSNENTESKEKKLPDPFGVIEKAGDLPLVGQLLTLALFLETLLLTFKSSNILTFNWKEVDWSSEIGELIVGGLSYGLILALLLPLFETLMTAVLTWYPVQRLFETYDDKEAEKRPGGCVGERELRDKANAVQSTYLLDMHRARMQSEQNAARQTTAIGTVSLRMMVMLILNLRASSIEVPSTVVLAMQTIPVQWAQTLLAVVFITLFCLCVRSWGRNPYRTVWIYYPTLYEEIMQKREQRKKLYGVD